jgi:twinfilin-like protein
LQEGLNELDGVLTTSNSFYVLLRRNNSLTFIAYVPYRAKEDYRAILLENRHECVRQLGEEHFTMSVICKEIGEVTDARSWEERDAEKRSRNAAADNDDQSRVHENVTHDKSGIEDVGYKKNKCRLCDRRMKNKITPEALEALTKLSTPGMAVQIVLSHVTRLSIQSLTYPSQSTPLPKFSN